jgi:hypothetical protein
VNISGTMADFGKLGAMTHILTIGQTNIAGSIEDFVNSRRSLSTPQLTGTVLFDYPYAYGNNVTFNGLPVTGSTTNVQLTWTENTITFNGVTINA